MKGLIGILAVVALLLMGVTEFVMHVSYDRAIGGHLKRAADANTVELARQELAYALRNIEERDWTSGYTSVLWRTPDEDVSFWYENLNASLTELNEITEDATSLERSNMLMKLRETLLDKNETSEGVTAPPGIHKFPNNKVFAFFYTLLIIIAVVGFGWWFSEDSW